VDELWQQTRDELAEAYADLVAFAIASVEAVVVLLAAVLVAKVLKGRTHRSRTLGRLTPNIVALLANAASIVTYVIAASIILGLFGANWTALLAVLSVSTVAISLALQDVLKNYIAGVYILLEQPFKIGDRIGVRDIDGVVETIEIRTTILTNDGGERVLVPNATIFSEVVTNRSATHLRRRTVFLEGLKQPTAEVERMVNEALSSGSGEAATTEPGRAGLDGRAPRLSWQAFTADGASLKVETWQPALDGVVTVDLAALRDAFPDAVVRLAED